MSGSMRPVAGARRDGGTAISARLEPRKAMRLRSASIAERAEYGVAQAARRVDWSTLRNQFGLPIEFSVPLAGSVPELAYGVFSDARVLSRSGYPVTATGAFLMDAINVNERSRFRTYQRPLTLAPEVRLEGVTVNLATVFSMTNYGHALLDGVGRLGLLAAAGFDRARVDHVILPAFPSPTIRRLAVLAGFREETLITPPIGANFRCERLVQTTFPGRPRVYSPAPAEFMRSLAITPEGERRRLLLLREGDRRTVANRDEVATVAREFDLEIYDPRASAFSPADFAAAELVVGAHGAGLADIAAAAPGTRVIELMPSAHKYPYFATLAASSHLDYVALECESIGTEPHADFTVDTRALRALLTRPSLHEAREPASTR